MRVARARAEKLSENSLKTLHTQSVPSHGYVHVSQNLPFVVLGFALALETIHTVHVIRFVVATVQEELFRS